MDCRRDITSADVKGMHEVRNPDTNKLVGVLHRKCWFARQKAHRIGGRHGGVSPTAYEKSMSRRNADDVEAAALRSRQAEIEEQRKLEDPRGEDTDWREPTTFEV